MKPTQVDREALAANLHRLRKEAGMTQDQLAAKALLHHTQISRLENAKVWPRTTTALLICRALGVSLRVLLAGTFWTEPLTAGAKAEAEQEGRELLAANIRRYRAAAGISQKTLAKRSGLHESEIGALERGIRSPKASTLLRLCGGLSITATELFDGIAWDPVERRYAAADIERQEP